MIHKKIIESIRRFIIFIKCELYLWKLRRKLDKHIIEHYIGVKYLPETTARIEHDIKNILKKAFLERKISRIEF